MNELEQYIHGYFGVPNSDLQQLSSLFKRTELKKGDFFVKEDQHCQYLSFIRSGFIRIYNYVDGKDVTQWISSQGEFVTDLSSLMFNNSARMNMQAMTDCSLYSISKQNYNRISTLIPSWGKLEKLFLAKCFITLEDRVFSFLSMTAEQRYSMLFERSPELFNQVPLHYIASMLRMTPETLSRIRKKSIS